MKRPAPVSVVACFVGCVVGLVGAGCGGGPGRARDGSSDGEVGGDAPPEEAQASDAGGAAGDGATADAAPKPPPVAAEGSRHVVPGAAFLVGHGLDSCTNASAPGGDRWCAFARPAGDYNELWVLDVTKAAAGGVACDGSDASCLRLSTRLYENRATGYGDHGFDGDTLIYGETTDRGAATSPFLGVIWAWRPGWPSGRSLTSSAGLFCMGHPASDAALCFDNRKGDGMIVDLTVDLLAGHLPAAGQSGLPRMDALLLVTPTDAPGAPARWRADLSPDGQYVAWSTRSPTSTVETLHAFQLGTKSEPVVVAQDVSQWAISPDGAAWTWLAGYNYDVTGAPAGTLELAAFPGAGGRATLATAVGDFGAIGASGLWLRANVTAEVGELRVLADRLAPTNVATIDTKVLTVLDHTADGSRFLYAKTYAQTRLPPATTGAPPPTVLDLYVRGAGGAPCVVSGVPAALEAAFAPGGDLVVWSLLDAATGGAVGVATGVSSCQSKVFAAHLGGLVPVGDAAIATLEDPDDATREATLRYARVVNGALGPSLLVETRAARVVAAVASDPPALAFTVSAGGPEDGLYLYAPPAGGDAGTANDGGDGGDVNGGADAGGGS
jgi:hypothetical protein